MILAESRELRAERNRYGMNRIKRIMGILDDILIGFLIDIIENGTEKCSILDIG